MDHPFVLIGIDRSVTLVAGYLLGRYRRELNRIPLRWAASFGAVPWTVILWLILAEIIRLAGPKSGGRRARDRIGPGSEKEAARPWIAHQFTNLFRIEFRILRST